MPITLNGNGTVTGLAVGGLPDGTVDQDTLATGVGGKILQVVRTFKGDGFTTASTSFTDITGLSVTITPTAASSKIFLICTMGAAGTRQSNLDYGNGIRVMRSIAGGTFSNDNKLNGAADGNRERISYKGVGWSYNNDHMPGGLGFSGLDDPTYSVGNAIIYKVQVAVQSGSYPFLLNKNSANIDNSTIAQSRSQTSLTVMEVAA